jgi:hypothetical protein|tara:strand:+ start:872 stop:1111 length:240 start_codon:yes stop_codon:yes gene_type:complete
MTLTLDELNSMLPDKLKRAACINECNAAMLIGVSASGLSNYRKEGIGPEYIKVENGAKARILYPKTCILKWLNNTVKTA